MVILDDPSYLDKIKEALKKSGAKEEDIKIITDMTLVEYLYERAKVDIGFKWFMLSVLLGYITAEQYELQLDFINSIALGLQHFFASHPEVEKGTAPKGVTIQ